MPEKPYLGTILLIKASLLSFKNDFAGSEKMAVSALKSGINKKDDRLIYSCYIALGESQNGLKNYSKALEYYYKAIEATAQLKDDYQLESLQAAAFNYIAQVYQKQGNYGKAIVSSERALGFSNFRKTDPKMYAYIINNLAYSKFKTGDKSTLRLFKEALTLSDSLKSTPTQVSIKMLLAEYYLVEKDTAAALVNAREAKAKAHANSIFVDELSCLKLLVQIDPKNNQAYNNRFINLTDSLQMIERETRDKYARIEFETDEITSEKNLIQTKNEVISQRIWFISAFSFLGFIIIVLWTRNKSQKSRNKELQFIQEQQKSNEEIYRLMLDQQQKIEQGKQLEKKRISQELHDGVMGRLTSIRLNLFVLSKKTDPETIDKCLAHINEIQNIEKEIRIIAHDLNKNYFSDQVNFISIIQNLCTAMDHSDIAFKLEADESINWELLDSNTKMQIYRIVQEALQNISKYAVAKNVTIRMVKGIETISIEVSDDGIGYDTTKVKQGIGLKNMQERIREVGGEIQIESRIGKGTKINFKVSI